MKGDDGEGGGPSKGELERNTRGRACENFLGNTGMMKGVGGGPPHFEENGIYCFGALQIYIKHRDSIDAWLKTVP